MRAVLDAGAVEEAGADEREEEAGAAGADVALAPVDGAGPAGLDVTAISELETATSAADEDRGEDEGEGKGAELDSEVEGSRDNEVE